MIYFVGAGSGAVDLITVRGARLLGQADVIIYAGSLVNPALLSYKKEGCLVHNSATMTLEQVLDTMTQAEAIGQLTVRLHTGDPSIYGAIGEQIKLLKQRQIAFEVVPGVSSFCGAAASLGVEYTVPDGSQTVILTRMAGRTPVPEQESIRSLATHQASMAVFLSAGMLADLSQQLVEGGYPKTTKAAIVYKATWPDEKRILCTVETLAAAGEEHQITKTALVLVGSFLDDPEGRSKLYDPGFTTGFREAVDREH